MSQSTDNLIAGQLRGAAEAFLRTQGLPRVRVLRLELNGPGEYWALITRDGRAEIVVIRGAQPEQWKIEALFAGWPVP